MKFLTYSYDGIKSLGCLINESDVLNISHLSYTVNENLPDNLSDYLINFDLNNILLKKIINSNSINTISLNEVKIESLIQPKSFRDFYAFRQHVKAGRKSRGLKMIPEYDEFPVFYFSNHNSVIGPGKIELFSKQIDKLDFELEIGLIISKHGRNIKAKDAFKHVAGFTILNDWSSRTIQMKEMKLNLGPAKGKDFATSIGPYLVTLDELQDKMIGNIEELRYDLSMEAFLNDKLISSDNFKNITWSFSDMIERASYGVDLVPGDLIGSGTCATGCLLELNQTNNKDSWLQDSDTITLSIDKLGVLENKVSCIDL
jgi:fumarylacetoacetate (FAA) hydrolase